MIKLRNRIGAFDVGASMSVSAAENPNVNYVYREGGELFIFFACIPKTSSLLG